MEQHRKVYIVHGWTYSLERWDALMKALAMRELEPVMLKVPGLSTPSDEVWDIPRYVEWLDDHLHEVDNPVVIGHSNGGRIAMAYDAKYPGKLAHLVLIASAGIYHDDWKIRLKRGVLKPVAQTLKPVLKGKARKLAYKAVSAGDYGQAPPNMRKTMTNVINFDKDFDRSQVTAPTTLIWGERDRLTPLKDAKQLQQELPHAGELHIVHNAGHSPHDVNPSLVADIIVESFGETR